MKKTIDPSIRKGPIVRRGPTPGQNISISKAEIMVATGAVIAGIGTIMAVTQSIANKNKSIRY